MNITAQELHSLLALRNHAATMNDHTTVAYWVQADGGNVGYHLDQVHDSFKAMAGLLGYEVALEAPEAAISLIDDIKEGRAVDSSDMEAALLAADELAGKCAAITEGRHHHTVTIPSLPDAQVVLDKPVFDSVVAALSAYRKAVEDTQ